MSEMVERLSFVLQDWRENGGPSSGCARAVLAAIREPTEAMEKAGAVVWDDDWCTETNAMHMWRAMCDEARR